MSRHTLEMSRHNFLALPVGLPRICHDFQKLCLDKGHYIQLCIEFVATFLPYLSFVKFVVTKLS